MLVLGVDRRKRIIPIDENDLRYHTVIIGQSGSGKSYFITRLLEEIILKTLGRLIIIDPNGDFSSFDTPREEAYWSEPLKGPELKGLRQQGSTHDDFVTFQSLWSAKQFVFLSSNRTTRGGPAKMEGLRVYWASLNNEQDFFLDIDPIQNPKLYQGTIICSHYVDDRKSDFPNGSGLRDFEQIAKDFGFGKIARADVPEAAMLSESDWIAVGLAYRKIRKRYYRILDDALLRKQPNIPADLSDHIAQGFGKRDQWQCCVVGLAAEELGQMLFATNATLDRAWKEATHSWSKARAQREKDVRVPTFIVIDEAHNFAPDEPSNALQARVSDKIAQIASEGRKYGLYLILATQRPKKLRKGLLSECENSALLRIQSKVERTYAVETLGIPSDTIEQIGSFVSGTALMHGRWSPATMPIVAAPVRTILGGGDIDPLFWTEPQQPAPDVSEEILIQNAKQPTASTQAGLVVLGVQQEAELATDREAKGRLTVNIGRPTFTYTATGKMFPKFIDVPEEISAKLISAPPNTPETKVFIGTGTTFDFNIKLKSQQFGVALPVGVYKFEYQLKSQAYEFANLTRATSDGLMTPVVHSED